MEGIKALGLSHKTAPLELREKVAFEESEASEFLLRLRDIFGIEEALMVSTCNRTELYYSSTKEIAKDLIHFIASFKGILPGSLFDYFRQLDTQASVEHLFRVSLGLESQVLGDIQISNQIKRAYQLSADLNMAGPYLHRLMHTIFYANKRVVQETTLQDGTASVASVAVDLIDGFISKIKDPKIALIGLGEIGQNVLDNLGDIKAEITLVNRTKSKADKFAGDNVKVQSFDELENIIHQSDVVISAVACKSPIITDKHIHQEIIHKLFIDLSVPRSMSQSLEEIPGISLYNVDQLQERTLKVKERREKAVPHVEGIIHESIKGFNSWKSEMEVSPTIQKLKNMLDKIRQEEIARYSNASDKERELLEIVTKNMIQKVIRLPAIELKAACKRGEADTMVEVLNDLFNLENQESEKK